MNNYNCGLLYYGSIYNNLKNKNCNIVEGPMINIKLSGLAFQNSNKQKLTRNFHPLGNPIKSSILLFTTNNVKETMEIILHREYYYKDDDEPLCYLKKKNNGYSLKIPYYDTYLDINDNYLLYINKLYNNLILYSKKYNLDYIFFISYSHNHYIDSNLSNILFNNKIIKLLSKSKCLYYNTYKYLLKCDPKTYSSLEKSIIKNIKLFL